MLKRFVLWDYPRGSWHYDVMVGLIVAFIFLTPREWFRDQPRIPDAHSIAMLPGEFSGSPSMGLFWIDKVVLGDKPDGAAIAKATQALRTRTGNRRLSVTGLEPIRGSEGELLGYVAFARP